MPWFNVDDGFAFHRKTVRAGNAAVGLWVRAGSWCAQQLTDGFIPDDMIAVLGTPAQADRLVKAELWIKTDGGYQFHEWAGDGRNKTRVEVLERRAKEAAKKAAARARAANLAEKGKIESSRRPNRDLETFADSDDPFSESPQVDDLSPQGTHAGLPLGLPEGVRSTTPLHSQEKKTSSSSAGRKRPATRLPADWKPTETHQQYATEHRLDIGREVFKFRHHAEANDRKQAGWNAAFSTWLANAADWTPKPKSAGNEEWRRYSEQ